MKLPEKKLDGDLADLIDPQFWEWRENCRLALVAADAMDKHIAQAFNDAKLILSNVQEWQVLIQEEQREKLEPQSPKSLGSSESDETMNETEDTKEIGRAVQQECRDRSRMPSSA
eukprot:TRINITY_DN98874_c0_g1_i1.p1 TRINITY_DN98874_c0_g1~~TRINITY_DN98874_c0_g1_i1.p1  ORF type:complete len:115 (-),score=23.15 TRINITY_DN98874_c0_g1_i1:11-355(-)